MEKKHPVWQYEKGTGTLPGQVFDPLVRWYAEHDQILRATSFIVALISFGLISALAFGDTAGYLRSAVDAHSPF